MKTSTPSFSSSLLLLLLLLLPFSLRHTAAQNLIGNTCKQLSKDDPNVPYTFCITSLQAAPASQCASLKGLGMISIWLTRDNVTDTRCHIKHLQKNKKLSPYVRACLDDCLELYSDAIPSIKQAMKSYRAKRYIDANVQVSSVMDAATTCEDGFSEQPGVVSPLTKRNNDTFKLGAMVLYIMKILQTGSD